MCLVVVMSIFFFSDNVICILDNKYVFALLLMNVDIM